MNSEQSLLAPGQEGNGLCGRLHAATLCTNNMDDIKNAYIDGMELTLKGPIPLTQDQIKAQRKIYDIPEELSYDYYHLYRASVPSLVQLRVLHFHQDVPPIHESYKSTELGPFSLGFPNLDQLKMDKMVADVGIGSMAPMQVGTITKPDLEYTYYETIYKFPDNLHAVGIARSEEMPPISPCDEKTRLGGPGYSAQVLENSDDFIPFLTDVLDLKLIGDDIWHAAENGALGVPADTPFRFLMFFSKGTKQNHFLFLDFFGVDTIRPEVPPRIPNRGLGSWSMETQDIQEVYRRAKDFGCHIVSEPHRVTDPILGECDILTFHAPNGFLIEIFQSVARSKSIGIQAFENIIVGTFTNTEQVEEEKRNGNQIHPMAKHVTEVMNHRIKNLPADFDGTFILEESYYDYPGKDTEIKPLLFKITPEGENSIGLESIEIPENWDKKDIVNSNPEFYLDYNTLTTKASFGRAIYTNHGNCMKVDHHCDFGSGYTFNLVETLIEGQLQVLEVLKKDGKIITPYNTPIIYKKHQ